MTTVGRSFDVAREVLADGFSCQEALSEWMRRLAVEGLRYCPLAQEQILLSCIDEDAEEPPLDIPASVEELVVEEISEGTLIIPDILEEIGGDVREIISGPVLAPPPAPVPDVGVLESSRTPGVNDLYFLRYSYVEPVLPDGSGGLFQTGDTELQTFAATFDRYGVFPAQSGAVTLVVFIEADTGKVLGSKSVYP